VIDIEELAKSDERHRLQIKRAGQQVYETAVNDLEECGVEIQTALKKAAERLETFNKDKEKLENSVGVEVRDLTQARNLLANLEKFSNQFLDLTRDKSPEVELSRKNQEPPMPKKQDHHTEVETIREKEEPLTPKKQDHADVEMPCEDKDFITPKKPDYAEPEIPRKHEKAPMQKKQDDANLIRSLSKGFQTPVAEPSKVQKDHSLTPQSKASSSSAFVTLPGKVAKKRILNTDWESDEDRVKKTKSSKASGTSGSSSDQEQRVSPSTPIDKKLMSDVLQRRKHAYYGAKSFFEPADKWTFVQGEEPLSEEQFKELSDLFHKKTGMVSCFEIKQQI